MLGSFSVRSSFLLSYSLERAAYKRVDSVLRVESAGSSDYNCKQSSVVERGSTAFMIESIQSTLKNLLAKESGLS